MKISFYSQTDFPFSSLSCGLWKRWKFSIFSLYIEWKENVGCGRAKELLFLVLWWIQRIEIQLVKNFLFFFTPLSMIKSSFWSHCWGEDGGGGTIEVKEEEEIDDENVRIFHKRDDKVFFSQLFFSFLSPHLHTHYQYNF